MVRDDRMPRDVLFLVFEEDFRFWPQGEDPDSADDYKARLGDVLKEKKSSRSPNKIKKKPQEAEAAPQAGQASSSSSGAYRPDAKGKEKGKNIVTEHHYTPVRGSTDVKDLNDGLSSNVADLLRMATKCHRENMGDIIWFGWCPPNNGSTPIVAIQRIAWCDADTKRSYGDIGGYARGKGGKRPHRFGARPLAPAGGRGQTCEGFLHLPLGGAFFEHPSACDPKNFGEAQGGRPAGWSIKCASKGTRTIHDDDKGQRGKWIIQWVGNQAKETGSGSLSQRTQSCTRMCTGGSHSERKSLPPP